ncbi:hypothetical protein MRX96_022733 [Rhipicephalus microplus]
MACKNLWPSAAPITTDMRTYSTCWRTFVTAHTKKVVSHPGQSAKRGGDRGSVASGKEKAAQEAYRIPVKDEASICPDETTMNGLASLSPGKMGPASRTKKRPSSFLCEGMQNTE